MPNKDAGSEAVKMLAARAVGYRESLLMQLNAVCLHWPVGRTSQATEAVRLLANLSKELREAGLQCVEKVVAWVLAVSDTESGPRPFLWNGSDYLVKMFVDLDFVSTQLGKKAWTVGNFCRGNPLLLSKVSSEHAYIHKRRCESEGVGHLSPSPRVAGRDGGPQPPRKSSRESGARSLARSPRRLAPAVASGGSNASHCSLKEVSPSGQQFASNDER